MKNVQIAGCVVYVVIIATTAVAFAGKPSSRPAAPPALKLPGYVQQAQQTFLNRMQDAQNDHSKAVDQSWKRYERTREQAKRALLQNIESALKIEQKKKGNGDVVASLQSVKEAVQRGQNLDEYLAHFSKRVFKFDSEDKMTEDWTIQGKWRLENGGLLFLDPETTLGSRFTLEGDCTIDIDYSISEQCELFITVWGETLTFEGGGTVRISRKGNNVTYHLASNAPSTIVLKREASDYASPITMRLVHRRYHTPKRELFLTRIMIGGHVNRESDSTNADEASNSNAEEDISKAIPAPLTLPGKGNSRVAGSRIRGIDILANKRAKLEGEVKADKGVVTIDGKNGMVSAADEVAVPFIAEFVAKTTSTDIRIQYREMLVIINWEGNPTELRFHDMPGGNIYSFPGQGMVPKNQWVRITLKVSHTDAEVLVDGKTRGKISNRDYKGLSGKLSILGFATPISVKEFRVTSLKGGSPARK